MTCIVGAVLDSLHATAQDAADKSQASGRAAGTRNTRSGRGNAEAEAALKMAQGIVQWIDGVDQDGVEDDVMQVVKEQNWPVHAPVHTVTATLSSSTSATDTETLPLSDVPPHPAGRTSTKAHSPGSPHRHKRKAEDTPGSVTRSATKAKRTEPSSVQKSAQKSSSIDHKHAEFKNHSHAHAHVPLTASKTSLMSPRAPAARPAFLHGLGAKIPVLNLHAAVTATPSRAASSSASVARRSPLKAMPLSLQQQILNSAVLRHQDNINSGTDEPAMDRATKWMKPPPQPEENDMKSALESRLSAMRYHLLLFCRHFVASTATSPPNHYNLTRRNTENL